MRVPAGVYTDGICRTNILLPREPAYRNKRRAKFCLSRVTYLELFAPVVMRVKLSH